MKLKSPNLLIPYGLVDSKPVLPEFAKRGVPYDCPLCNSDLFLRYGPICRRKHFWHRTINSGCSSGSGEGVEHLAAKLRVYSALIGTSKSIDMATRQPCLGCGKAHDVEITLDDSHQGQVFMEYLINTNQGAQVRPDIVVITGDSSPKFAIEIVATNPITADKESKLTGLGLPWAEINAFDHFSSGIRALRTGNLNPRRACPPTPQHIIEENLVVDKENIRDNRIRNMATGSWSRIKRPDGIHRHAFFPFNEDHKKCALCGELKYFEPVSYSKSNSFSGL
ncbi:hypothetical protein M1N56_05530 [Dehalococcoidia bacterium]|nr:hypothetical protein [Dehalococcoidia bacterium]